MPNYHTYANDYTHYYNYYNTPIDVQVVPEVQVVPVVDPDVEREYRLDPTYIPSDESDNYTDTELESEADSEAPTEIDVKCMTIRDIVYKQTRFYFQHFDSNSFVWKYRPFSDFFGEVALSDSDMWYGFSFQILVENQFYNVDHSGYIEEFNRFYYDFDENTLVGFRNQFITECENPLDSN